MKLAEKPKADIDPALIREILEGWARWAHYSRGRGSRSILASLMDGMAKGRRICKTCAGLKRVAGHKVGSSLPFVKCPDCEGEGAKPLEAERPRQTLPCTACGGTGRRKGIRKRYPGTGEINGKTCPKCGGSGWRVYVACLANPAFIHGNGPHCEPSFPLYERVDRILAAWKVDPKNEKYYQVLKYEYVASGTQQQKARTMRWRYSTYTTRLQRAHEMFAEALKISEY